MRSTRSSSRRTSRRAEAAKAVHANHVVPTGLSFLLGRVYFAYRALVQQSLEERGHGGLVKPGMGSLLFSLYAQDGCTITVLARRLSMTKSTITEGVKHLEKNGLVRRAPHGSDGRSVTLHLTAKARSLKPSFTRLARYFDRTVAAGLSTRAIRRYGDNLTRTLRAINREVNRVQRSD